MLDSSTGQEPKRKQGSTSGDDFAADNIGQDGVSRAESFLLFRAVTSVTKSDTGSNS